LGDMVGGWSAKLMKWVAPVVLLNIIMVRNHYSVDVILGVVISHVVWDVMKIKEESKIQEFIQMENQLKQKMDVFNDVDEFEFTKEPSTDNKSQQVEIELASV